MRLVVQRVTYASVTVEGKIIGNIPDGGFMVLFGAGTNDTEKDCEKLSQKLIGLRIFPDENGKTNLSVKDVGGSLLIVPQFTLYADCRKGNRPSFGNAKEPAEAKRLYEFFCELCSREIPVVERGEFGADMKVELLNDGPFTVILECNNGEIPG